MCGVILRVTLVDFYSIRIDTYLFVFTPYPIPFQYTSSILFSSPTIELITRNAKGLLELGTLLSFRLDFVNLFCI